MEFEQQIREALNASRARLKDAGSALQSPVGQAVVGSAAAIAIGKMHRSEGITPDEAASTAVEHIDKSLKDRKEGVNRDGGELGQGAFSGAYAPFSARPVAPPRLGSIAGRWVNRCIAAAMPPLLVIERMRGQTIGDSSAIRAQLVREIQLFQQTLLKQQFLPEDVRRISYMLCTYIDSVLTSASDGAVAGLSLLVEFHRDSWGGDHCFEDLAAFMEKPDKYREILGFYHMILSLGYKGKYQVLTRGDVLLMDLFIRLNTMLYGEHATSALTQVIPEKAQRRVSYMSPIKLLGWGALVCLLAYAGISVYLHDRSRDIRSAILAWEPPVPRRINIMETLPQPLPQILSEGWLEVREDPRGWLLLFTSDGAFKTGQSVLSAEFVKKRNIERLGEALAGWPGDLEVIGHTDAQPFRSGKNTNLKLSQDRAETVADRLRQGTLVNSKYQREIEAIGKGDTEPLADNATEEGRRKNRRVDILWKVGERANSSKEDIIDRLNNGAGSAGVDRE